MARKKRLDVWRQMKPAARRKMALAVFLMFGAIGPITVLMESKIAPVSWSFVAIQTISIGGLASGTILFINRRWLVALSIFFWLNVMTMNSGSLSFVGDEGGFRVHLGSFEDAKAGRGKAEAVTLTPAEINVIYEQHGVLGIMAIVLLVVGYYRFVVVIRSEVRERTRLQTEVAIAQGIQTSLLPHESFRNEWCTVAGSSVPASEVGGDYYDAIGISGTQVAVMIADVAGHGVGSGIVSAMTKSALHSQVLRDASPVAVLENLNMTLCRISGKKMFVTCAYVLLDRGESTMRIATAGHPPVLHRASAPGALKVFRTDGMALGLKNDATYREVSVPMAPGDALLLYTDGVTEAMDAQGEQFGAQRLEEWFARAEHEDPEGISAGLLTAIRGFSGPGALKDDVTVVAVSVR
jgi:hypothetical protein